VVFAVEVVAEARMLEGVLSFRVVDKGLRRPIEMDSVSLNNFSIGGLSSVCLVGSVEPWRSQDATF